MQERSLALMVGRMVVSYVRGCVGVSFSMSSSIRCCGPGSESVTMSGDSSGESALGRALLRKAQSSCIPSFRHASSAGTVALYQVHWSVACTPIRTQRQRTSPSGRQAGPGRTGVASQPAQGPSTSCLWPASSLSWCSGAPSHSSPLVLEVCGTPQALCHLPQAPAQSF